MDAYVKDYDTKQHVEGEYLTTSHVIKRGNKKVRYDFVFVNEEKIVDFHKHIACNGLSVLYLYQNRKEGWICTKQF